MRFVKRNNKNLLPALVILVGALAVFFLVTGQRTARIAPPERPAGAPAADCELCNKPLVRGKEVVVRNGGAQHLYRCVHCALTAMAAMEEARAKAFSGQEHKSIEIMKKVKGWEVKPASAIFLVLPEAGDECIDRHQTFVDEGEFARYLKAHPQLEAKSPKKFTILHLAEMLEAGKAAGAN